MNSFRDGVSSVLAPASRAAASRNGRSLRRPRGPLVMLAFGIVLSIPLRAHAQGAPGDGGGRPAPPPEPPGSEATCRILIPPGDTQAAAAGTPWSARLTAGGPLVLGVVPYVFDANVTPMNQGRALASMQEIMRVSDVQFVPRAPAFHPNWLHIRDAGANSSLVGMFGGQQFVNIASWNSNQPNVNFIIVHELLHALGFWHEHQRIDRDNPPGTPFFVAIDTMCIDPPALPNFDVVPGAALTGAYDFESVMHYSQRAFSIMWPGCPTIVVQPPFQVWQTLIGQRVQLSQIDIDGLCARYGCTPPNNTCATATSVTNGTTITNTRGSSTSPAGGCPGLLNDTWHVYDAPCTGQVTIALDTPSAGYTPALAVYRSPCGTGALVACDTSAPVQASFPVTQNERYYLRVGGVGGSTGTARLHIACAPINCITALQWAQAATTGPGARRNHAMVYDSTRQRIILFGGVVDLTDLGDTWEWDPMAQAWTLRTTAGPSPRMHHAMAYDSARQRVVLFGGSPNHGDTWEYDAVANQWQLRATTGPLARSAHAMAYDSARQRVVMFGGSGAGFTGDTWEWNGATGMWTQPPVVGTVPPERNDFGMAYDAARARTVMWGGHPSDTSAWEWNGTQWTERVAGFVPAARSGHELVYDAAASVVLMYGGWQTGPVFHDDLWSWNGTTWNAHGNAGAPARAWYASAFDASSDALLVHGGSDGLLRSDTWRALLSGLPHDDPAGATLVGNGSHAIDTRCAAHGSAGCASDHDLWFRYDAVVSGSLSVSVTGASFTPRVAIHDAANPGGAPLACGTGAPAVATVTTFPGSYLIRVGSAPGTNGGVGTLHVNGQPQPCPPVFNIADFNTFRHRMFEVTGTSNDQPWAWSIKRGGDLMFEVYAPPVPAGANAPAIAAAFVASINAHACPDNRLLAVQISPPYTYKFRVIVGGSTDFSLCVGPAGQLPTCCLPAAGTCAFNPDIREIMLSGEDCNANGEDDTIDLLLGTSEDFNENGVLDDCEVCVGDLDGSGSVGFQDLLQILAAWGPCPKCPQDLDLDGVVGFADLLQVLSGWGPCE